MMKKNASTLKLCKNLFQINQTDIEMSVFFYGKIACCRPNRLRNKPVPVTDSGDNDCSESNSWLLAYNSFKNGTLTLVL